MGGAERRWVSCFEGEVDGSRVRMKQTMRAQRRQSKRSGRRASDVESGEMDGERRRMTLRGWAVRRCLVMARATSCVPGGDPMQRRGECHAHS
jgi:hypothetical protein